MKPGDKVRFLKDYGWSNVIPKGTIVEATHYKDGMIHFLHPVTKSGIVAIFPQSSVLELVQEETATKPCSCSRRTIFDKGCQCGGI